ncbi:hypothetical protein HU200_067223 [Digitaria exilis]|uniref:Uncharacterized protein n=1 Tax=Digitaria exilis TaxID=1010633 RepID=A0A834ZWM7_9POAL|nr:hypothetical protein HU200_067223 [Digitaria exilis]
MSSFRVLLCSIEDGCIRACMFTSSLSSSWRQTSIDVPPKMHAIGFAIDRRYWYDGEKRMVALDQSILKFSSFVLPDDEYSECRKMSCVTVGHDGEPRIVVRGRGNMIKIFVRLKGGSEDTEEWALEKTVQVSAAMLGLRELQFFVLTTDQPAGMVRFDAYEFSRHGFSMSMTFHLDMETMKTEGLAGRGVHYGHKAYPLELPWPPTLHACTMASQIHPGVPINV